MSAVHTVVLAGHIAAGVAALALGPLALIGAAGVRRWPAWLGRGYLIAVGVLTGSALGLVALDPPRLWWLIPIAVATAAAAIGGWRIGRRPSGRWSAWHVRLMGGSYVSLVTALVVVSWGTVLAWVLPAVLGALVVETAAPRAGRWWRPHGATP